MPFKIISLFLLLIIPFSCTTKEERGYTPKKHTKVPDGAFWKGGAGGGNWFLVRNINDHRNKAWISIYDDKDGTLLTTSTFTLICNVINMVIIDDLKQQINFFDGKRIQLINKEKTECWLEPSQ